MNKIEKSKTVRIKIEYYNFLKDTSVINKRSLGGQIYWISDVLTSIQKNDPEYYAKVVQKINTEKAY